MPSRFTIATCALAASAFLMAAAASGADDAAAKRPAGPSPAGPPTPPRIAGYLPDYRAFDPALAAHLTDLILFSAEPTAAGELDLSRLKKVSRDALLAFKTRQRVRLLLCVGGWDRSTHFPAVATSKEKRRIFVAAAVRTCLDERFDGLDLDWEHPESVAELQGYADLLAELRDAFKPHGLVLSVTITPSLKLPAKAFDAVDWVQVMSYDHPGRHATFEAARDDIKALLAAGAPARKLTLGLPLYGRDPNRRDRTLDYRDIVARHRPAPDADEIDGLYFNGPATLGRKTEYALSAGLAGVMVWELGQDAGGDQSMVKMIRETVDRRTK